jgi:hypothetical protein
MNIIYNKLFEYRLNLQEDDAGIDELYIIKELKYYLLDNDVEEATINQTLYDFYKMFDINIDMTVIEQVPIRSINFDTMSDPYGTSFFNQMILHLPSSNYQLNHNPNSIFQELFSILLNNSPPIIHPQENVVVTTDTEDIKKLPTKKLDEKLDSKCSICMDSMDKDMIVTILNCDHTFHQECIETLMKEYSNKCPLCRKDIGNANANL